MYENVYKILTTMWRFGNVCDFMRCDANDCLFSELAVCTFRIGIEYDMYIV